VSDVAFTLPKLDLMLEGEHTATITLKLQIKQQVFHLIVHTHTLDSHFHHVNADGWRWQEAEGRRRQVTQPEVRDKKRSSKQRQYKV